jgi:hypothetical protein
VVGSGLAWAFKMCVQGGEVEDEEDKTILAAVVGEGEA